jgi:hypothetical protein
MSQASLSSDDVWQSLFQSALIVVDEIRRHGGRADPFFTFVGGTALMLRYQHRLSKDIDLFVPDPQSPAYVTPRLSVSRVRTCLLPSDLHQQINFRT